MNMIREKRDLEIINDKRSCWRYYLNEQTIDDQSGENYGMVGRLFVPYDPRSAVPSVQGQRRDADDVFQRVQHGILRSDAFIHIQKIVQVFLYGNLL